MTINWFSLTLTPTTMFFNAPDEIFERDFESIVDGFVDSYLMYCSGNSEWLLNNKKPIIAHFKNGQVDEYSYKNEKRTGRLLTEVINRLESTINTAEAEKFLDYLSLFPGKVYDALEWSDELKVIFVKRDLKVK